MNILSQDATFDPIIAEARAKKGIMSTESTDYKKWDSNLTKYNNNTKTIFKIGQYVSPYTYNEN